MAKHAVLLLNLGTPLSPEPHDVGPYLDEFLMDPYVINLPWPLRALLVKALIVPRRRFASSEKYKKIWNAERGSPLLYHSQDLAQALAKALARQDIEVKYAMRYGAPSIREALVEWKAHTPKHILVIPLYPQYAEASTLTGTRAVEREAQDLGLRTRIDFFPAFFEHPAFVRAKAQVIDEALSPFGADHVLFSFHGLPKAQVMRTDPTRSWCGRNPQCCESLRDENQNCYRAQCFATARALASSLGLPAGRWTVSFQSRLGRAEWISPYTDHILPQLAKQGVKRLAVVCPSFTADCLETLEEMGIQGKEDFLKAGGEDYLLVPCLNSHPAWVDSLVEITREHFA